MYIIKTLIFLSNVALAKNFLLIIGSWQSVSYNVKSLDKFPVCKQYICIVEGQKKHFQNYINTSID